MDNRYEVYMEVFDITEWHGDVVYKTVSRGTHWFDKDIVDQNAPKVTNVMYVAASDEFARTNMTIRKRKPECSWCGGSDPIFEPTADGQGTCWTLRQVDSEYFHQPCLKHLNLWNFMIAAIRNVYPSEDHFRMDLELITSNAWPENPEGGES